MSPFLVCSPSLIISGLAPMESGLDILRGGGEAGGDRKAFHQAGKLKKRFGYQALAGLAPTPSVCACLIFLFFPPFSFFYFFLFFHILGGTECAPPLRCVVTTGILRSLVDCLISLNTGLLGQIP